MQHIERKPETVEEELPLLVRRLRSANPYRRQRVRRLLRRAGINAVVPLLSLLEEEKKSRSAYRGLRYGLGFLTAGCYVLWIMKLADPAYWPFAFVLLIPFITMLYLRGASRAQIEAVQILAELNDVRAVGPLAEALEFVDRWQITGTEWIAADALCRLLPQLKPEEGDLLNERQRTCLYHSLAAPVPQNPRLSVAIIQALTRIGDTHALPFIARLANMRPLTLTGRQIRDAAGECLMTLQAHLETQRAPHTLLRAVEGESRPDLLLHPVENPEPDPSVLLRPTDSD